MYRMLSDSSLLMALEMSADVLIAISYMLIPIALVLMLARMHESPRYGQYLLAKQCRLGVWLSVAVALAAGCGHTLHALTLFYPVHFFEACWDMATGVISAATALFFLRLAFSSPEL